MSEMTGVTPCALYSQVLGKDMEEGLLRRDWKTPIKGAEVTRFDKLFHVQNVP